MADIMEAARAVFVEKGYTDALTADIAERAGVVEGTIYRYFASKRDLLIKVIEAWYDQLYKDNERQLDGLRGTRNRLRLLVYRHLTLIHEDRAILRLLLNELRDAPEYRSTSVFKLNRRYTQRVKAVIDEGIKNGEFRDNVPHRIIRDMIFGGAEHYTFAYLRGEGDFSPAEAADFITDLICAGLEAKRPQPPRISDLDDAVVARFEDAVRRLETLHRNRAADS